MKKHILPIVTILVLGLGISSCSDYLSVERFLKTGKVKKKFSKAKFLRNNGLLNVITVC